MTDMLATIRTYEEKVLAGQQLTRDECRVITASSGTHAFDLFHSASRIREYFRGRTVDLCAIINAKSGACTEDCAWCAQSGRHHGSSASVFPLIGRDDVLAKAQEAKDGGARRFCIVTSGRKPSGREIAAIAEMVGAVRDIGLLPCATLGLLSSDELTLLRNAGLERYHNNLETSEEFFPSVCTTHTYAEKTATLRHAASLGLSLCSGGIFGLGETWDDRIAMAFSLRGLAVDSVPINFLTPIAGTRLGSRQPLSPLEALSIISLFRFILPDREIRVCGGRMQTLGEMTSMIFLAGADGLLIGNYLTTLGRDYEDDIKLIRNLGLTSAR